MEDMGVKGNWLFNININSFTESLKVNGGVLVFEIGLMTMVM